MRMQQINIIRSITGSFGGLLGLCLGFSLISIVEIAYFATVRLYRNIPLSFSTQTEDAQNWAQKKTSTENASDALFSQKVKRMYVNDFYLVEKRKTTRNRY